MQNQVEQLRAKEFAKIDQAKCISNGGSIRGVGMFGTPACVIPFSDAGKSCSDKTECLGLCKTDLDAEIGSQASGTCQGDDHDIFGCYNKIEKGIVVAGICLD